jgi:hypothetical protein
MSRIDFPRLELHWAQEQPRSAIVPASSLQPLKFEASVTFEQLFGLPLTAEKIVFCIENG